MISSRQLYATAALLFNTVFAQVAPRIAPFDLCEPTKLGKLQYCEKGYDRIDLGVDLQHPEYRCAVPLKQGVDCRKTGFACHLYSGHCYEGGSEVIKRGVGCTHPHFRDPCQRRFFCMDSCGAYMNEGSKCDSPGLYCDNSKGLKCLSVICSKDDTATTTTVVTVTYPTETSTEKCY